MNSSQHARLAPRPAQRFPLRGRILIIDDDDNIRSSLTFFLEEIGFSVIQTNNGTLALELIRDNKPDHVFCDVVMPGISGLVVLGHIKRAFPNQKVILMSGLNEESAIEEARVLGAETFLLKPVSLDDLEQNFINKIFPPA